MEKTIKLFVISMVIFAAMLIIPMISNAATFITDEESLRDAVSVADSGATITLQGDITVSQPIVIAKELTIDGNGHTNTGSSQWTSTSGN